MGRTLGSLLIAGIAAAALMALPASASPLTFCVTSSGATWDGGLYPADSLQTALNDAGSHMGTDTVRIGAGNYPTTSINGFSYGGADPVNIIGAGEGATTVSLTPPGAPPGAST